MALTLAQVMNMDLYALTEKNYSVTSLFIASAMIQVLEGCKTRGVDPSKVKFHSMHRTPDNRFKVGVSYG
jgi:hypothetical protein